jgi:lipopolysaccharide assembly protein A
MQIVRTIAWVLLLVLLLGFSFFNWKPVEVQIWDNLVLETKVPALVIVSFLLGLVPMWLIHRGTKWRLQRRIAGLESAARTNALTPAAAPPPMAPTASSAPPTTPAPPRPDPLERDDPLP